MSFPLQTRTTRSLDRCHWKASHGHDTHFPHPCSICRSLACETRTDTKTCRSETWRTSPWPTEIQSSPGSSAASLCTGTTAPESCRTDLDRSVPVSCRCETRPNLLGQCGRLGLGTPPGRNGFQRGCPASCEEASWFRIRLCIPGSSCKRESLDDPRRATEFGQCQKIRCRGCQLQALQGSHSSGSQQAHLRHLFWCMSESHHEARRRNSP